MKNKINANIIADSINDNGNRITTFVLTYPRIIHAEMLTHRLFSRNAASSRAIPASKMIKDIEEDPFIPVAWQKAHKGMQGTEYFTDKEDIDDVEGQWMYAKDRAVEAARMMNSDSITKQLVNRILEPYQWYTCIVTFTEGENFFELRCPQYKSPYDGKLYKSWKDLSKEGPKAFNNEVPLLSRLLLNKGQGEIHISLLAEAMWDAMNESKPKQLKAGEWHIPFGDKMDNEKLLRLVASENGWKYHGVSEDSLKAYKWEIEELSVKIATARCARVSYLNFEGKDDYEADIKLYDRLLEMKHMSPFEHCARAMSEEEYYLHVRGKDGSKSHEHGWSGNFKGFVQLRKEIE